MLISFNNNFLGAYLRLLISVQPKTYSHSFGGLFLKKIDQSTDEMRSVSVKLVDLN